MIIRSLRQAFMATTFLALIVSCGEKNSGDSSGGPGAGSQDTDNRDEQNNPSGPKVCKDARILKVLDNGNNVISRLTTDKNKIINWQINNGKEVSSLDFPVNPYDVSPDGEYIIRRINYKKYQVIKFGENKNRFNRVITINAAYDPMPKVEFSPDGEFLIMNYRPFAQGYSHRIDIYNLDQERFVSAMNAKNIIFAKVTRDSKYFLIGFQKGYHTVVQKVDVITSEVVYEIKINKYERFSKLYVGEDVFIVRGNNGYHAYNIVAGEHLYSKKLKQLFDIGSMGLNALVSDSWNEVKVLDLKTGDTIFKDKTPTGLILSTCKLLDNPLKVLCQDSVNQGKISIWDIAQSSATSACY